MTVWTKRDPSSLFEQKNSYYLGSRYFPMIKDGKTQEVIDELCKVRHFRPVAFDPLIGIGSDTHREIYKPAIDIIKKYVDKCLPICVSMDFDCDGLTAGACLLKILIELKADVTYALPNRFDHGYGLNVELIKSRAKPNSLIITVDNGISNAQEVKELTSLGYTVLITDHHMPENELPTAAYILNPKVNMKEEDDEYVVSGAYLSAKLGLLLAKEYLPLTEERYTYTHPWYQLWQYCVCLVGLAILSDMIEINDLMHYQLLVALTELKCNPPSKAVMEMIKLTRGNSKQPITEQHISYTFNPKINASGRMGLPQIGLYFLLPEMATREEKELVSEEEWAVQLDFLNKQRQEIEKGITEISLEMATEYLKTHKSSLVIIGKDWHLGVLGIVAAKLVDAFHRPTLVLSNDKDGNYTGSGRTPEGTAILEHVAACKDNLLRYGGHKAACGLAVEPKNIKALQKNFEKSCSSIDFTNLCTYYDVEVPISAISDIRFTMFIESCFRPYGNAHPALHFLLRQITPVKFSVDESKRFTVANFVCQGEDTDACIMLSKFNPSEDYLNLKLYQPYDFLVSVRWLYFGRKTKYELSIIDYRESSSHAVERKLQEVSSQA